ncbi:MAG: hypothetical protein FWD48_08545 [Oscillospiraceae bacterium]|nr:hypothetical protein [Oscillospiraceae bacterium]
MKKIIIISILIFALFLTACSNTETLSDTIAGTFEITEVISTSGMASRIVYNSLQKLLEPANWGAGVLEDYSADIAVIGEFIEDANAGFRYEYNEHFGKDVVVDAFARGQFLVTEVLHGDIKSGEIITIIQRYAFDEERKALISFSELTPMHKGDGWIYFLNRNGDVYDVVSEADGRYPIPDKELTQFINEVSSIMNAIEEWAHSKEQVESIASDKEEWRYYRDRQGSLYRFTEEEAEELDDFSIAIHDLLEKIDASALGVINRYDFNYIIYSEIIEYFKIETRDWVNPGREFDAKIIEIFEKQFKEFS